MTKWILQGSYVHSIEEFSPEHQYMVYRIQILDGERSGCYYYGSKHLFSSRRVKLSKRRQAELYKGRGGKPKYEVKRKESDWKEYNSSSNLVKELCSTCKVRFEILQLFTTKQEMLLKEAYLIAEAFLKRDTKILNAWINLKAVPLKQ